MLLDRLQRGTGRDYFELRHRDIRATQWVGSVGIGTKTIDVVPKIDVPDDGANRGARANLLHMLSRAGLVPVSPAGVAAMLATDKPLIRASSKSMYGIWPGNGAEDQLDVYVADTPNRPFLKGRLNVIGTERRNFLPRTASLLHDVRWNQSG